MDWISSKELAGVLNRKTPFLAIKWAKKEGINYFRKGAGFLGRYWFKKEEVLVKLKEMSKIATTSEVATILGVHRGTLKRWRKQGYLKPIGQGARKTLLFDKKQIVRLKPPTTHWLPWQEEKLIKGHDTEGLFRNELARQLGKSVQAVGSKISRMGLGKYKHREFYFLKDVAEEFFKTNRRRVKRWIKSEKLKTVPLKSIGGRIRYRISEEQIAEFMVRFPLAWQGLKPFINLHELPAYSKITNRKI